MSPAVGSRALAVRRPALAGPPFLPFRRAIVAAH